MKELNGDDEEEDEDENEDVFEIVENFVGSWSGCENGYGTLIPTIHEETSDSLINKYPSSSSNEEGVEVDDEDDGEDDEEDEDDDEEENDWIFCESELIGFWSVTVIEDDNGKRIGSWYPFVTGFDTWSDIGEVYTINERVSYNVNIKNIKIT